MTRRSLFKTILMLIAAFTVSAGKTARIIRIVARRCTGCKECLMVCPSGSIEMFRGKAEINPDSCTGCRLCAAVCSYGAVEQCTTKNNVAAESGEQREKQQEDQQRAELLHDQPSGVAQAAKEEKRSDESLPLIQEIEKQRDRVTRLEEKLRQQKLAKQEKQR